MSSTSCPEPAQRESGHNVFFKKLLKGLRYAPRVMITDKLASYGAARKQMRLSIEHRQHKGLNNRAENSHSTDATEGAADEKVQVTGAGAAFPFRAWPD